MINLINKIFGYCIRLLSIILYEVSDSLKAKSDKVNYIIDRNKLCKIYIPTKLLFSIILIEDRRFNDHLGVDLYSICRAIFNFLIKRKIEGASTITQQLVRIITNEREINLSRKIREIVLAALVEKKYSKIDIILTYAKIYCFNEKMGIQKLCESEGYNLSFLSINQISQIVARLKYPNVNSKNYIRYIKRVRSVEKKLLIEIKNYGYINKTSNLVQNSFSLDNNF